MIYAPTSSFPCFYHSTKAHPFVGTCLRIWYSGGDGRSVYISPDADSLYVVILFSMSFDPGGSHVKEIIF